MTRFLRLRSIGVCLAIFGMSLTSCSVFRPVKRDQTVCPEYRNMVCTAGAQCTLDRARGCQVCQCNPIPGLKPQQYDVPPPQHEQVPSPQYP